MQAGVLWARFDAALNKSTVITYLPVIFRVRSMVIATVCETVV